MRRKITTPWGTIITSSTTDDFIPATGWGDASEFDSVRCFCEVRGRGGTGSILISGAFQKTNDIRSPGTPTQIKLSGGDANGYANANGFFDADASLTSLAADDKRFLRFGWLVKVDSSSGHAAVSGGFELIPR